MLRHPSTAPSACPARAVCGPASHPIPAPSALPPPAVLACCPRPRRIDAHWCELAAVFLHLLQARLFVGRATELVQELLAVRTGQYGDGTGAVLRTAAPQPHGGAPLTHPLALPARLPAWSPPLHPPTHPRTVQTSMDDGSLPPMLEELVALCMSKDPTAAHAPVAGGDMEGADAAAAAVVARSASSRALAAAAAALQEEAAGGPSGPTAPSERTGGVASVGGGTAALHR